MQINTKDSNYSMALWNDFTRFERIGLVFRIEINTSTIVFHSGSKS